MSGIPELNFQSHQTDDIHAEDVFHWDVYKVIFLWFLGHFLDALASLDLKLSVSQSMIHLFQIFSKCEVM